MEHPTGQTRHKTRFNLTRMAVTVLDDRDRCLSDGQHIAGLHQMGGVGPHHLDRIIEGAQQMGFDGKHRTAITLPERRLLSGQWCGF